MVFFSIIAKAVKYITNRPEIMITSSGLVRYKARQQTIINKAETIEMICNALPMYLFTWLGDLCAIGLESGLGEVMV